MKLFQFLNHKTFIFVFLATSCVMATDGVNWSMGPDDSADDRWAHLTATSPSSSCISLTSIVSPQTFIRPAQPDYLHLFQLLCSGNGGAAQVLWKSADWTPHQESFLRWVAEGYEGYKKTSHHDVITLLINAQFLGSDGLKTGVRYEFYQLAQHLSQSPQVNMQEIHKRLSVLEATAGKRFSDWVCEPVASLLGINGSFIKNSLTQFGSFPSPAPSATRPKIIIRKPMSENIENCLKALRGEQPEEFNKFYKCFSANERVEWNNHVGQLESELKARAIEFVHLQNQPKNQPIGLVYGDLVVSQSKHDLKYLAPSVDYKKTEALMSQLRAATSELENPVSAAYYDWQSWPQRDDNSEDDGEVVIPVVALQNEGSNDEDSEDDGDEIVFEGIG